jgi:hypothetical protein
VNPDKEVKSGGMVQKIFLYPFSLRPTIYLVNNPALLYIAITTTITQEVEETGSKFRPVNSLTRQQTTLYQHAQY